MALGVLPELLLLQDAGGGHGITVNRNAGRSVRARELG